MCSFLSSSPFAIFMCVPDLAVPFQDFMQIVGPFLTVFLKALHVTSLILPTSQKDCIHLQFVASFFLLNLESRKEFLSVDTAKLPNLTDVDLLTSM